MIVPFLPLAAEANNALDVLLKGLDTVVAQAVAEAGDKAGHGGCPRRLDLWGFPMAESSSHQG